MNRWGYLLFAIFLWQMLSFTLQGPAHLREYEDRVSVSAATFSPYRIDTNKGIKPFLKNLQSKPVPQAHFQTQSKEKSNKIAFEAYPYEASEEEQEILEMNDELLETQEDLSYIEEEWKNEVQRVLETELFLDEREISLYWDIVDETSQSIEQRMAQAVQGKFQDWENKKTWDGVQSVIEEHEDKIHYLLGDDGYETLKSYKKDFSQRVTDRYFTGERVFWNSYDYPSPVVNNSGNPF